ncbi:MAG: phytoene desaturase family protein, partial [Anaerolineales bacterium]
LGKRDMLELLRVLPMSAHQYLNGHFENDALKGLLGSVSVTGLMQGPRASGAAFMLLYQQLGGTNGGYRSSRIVRGGVGKVSEALAAALKAHSGEIRTGASVSKILVERHRIVGLRLDSGDEIEANLILSSADPRTTFFGLLGGPELSPRIVRRLRSLKQRGSTASVHLALSDLPDFPSANGDAKRLTGAIVICPDMDYAERAYDDAKYGRISTAPILEVRIPSLLDQSLAPGGQHTMSIVFRYAPYHLRDSGWDTQHEKLGDLAIETLNEYAPNLKHITLNRKVITPLDYERDYRLAEGSIMHGQMGLDQLLLMRPVPGFIGYRSPVSGLYLCGAGAHPGGGLTGLPGLNAAKQASQETS